MLQRARSFEVRSGSLGAIVRAFRAAQGEVPRASAGVVFVSGALVERQEALARALVESERGIPLLVVGGSGVLSERGEVEGQSAATGLVWSGAAAQIGAIDASEGDDGLCEGLEGFLDRTGNRGATLLFVRPGGFSPRAIQRLGSKSFGDRIFGGGAVGEPGVIAVGAGGELITGRAVAMSLSGLGQPRVATTYSCRLLGPLQPITQARGSLVLRLGDHPALDVLTELGRNLDGQPLVFTVLARSRARDTAPDEARRELLVRGVQGIDPHLRGLVVSDEVEEGMLMTFGVRDRRAARGDLERLSRQINRDMAGAAPLCALYVNCGGRGRALYGRGNVDTKILTERFGDIPIAGMQSSFEIAPYGGSASFQLYTGVLSLFSALS